MQLVSREGDVSLQILVWVSSAECESVSPLNLPYALKD